MKKIIKKLGTKNNFKHYMTLICVLCMTSLSSLTASAEAAGGWGSATSFIETIRDNLTTIGYSVGTLSVVVLGIGIAIANHNEWSSKFKEGFTKICVSLAILTFGPAIVMSFVGQ